MGLTHFHYQSYTHIFKDFQEFINIIHPLSTDCDLDTFYQAINRITHGGYLSLMKNYLFHMSAVNHSFENLRHCGTEYLLCGLYAGDIFKYLIGFSLHSTGFIAESPVFVLKTNNYEDFIMGVLKGLQSGPTTDSQCVSDFSSLSGNFDTFGKDFEDLVAGKTGSFSKLLNDVKSLEIPNMVEECNIYGLVDQIEVLTGPNGFMILWNNYAKNEPEISQDLEVLNNCEKDLFSCGEAIGNAFQLLVGWSI